TQASKNLAAHLRQASSLELTDVAYTLQTGRPLFNYRQALVCHNLDDAALALETNDASQLMAANKEGSDAPVTFLFPGQGSQYVNMGRDLYRSETVFRTELDRCAELIKPHLGSDLREVLYPAEEGEQAAASQNLKQTWLTQPALFTLEYVLARQWMAWGVRPAAMIGHSIGEYTAACLAGVFSLEDALRLVAARGRLMQQLPAGAMLALSLPKQEIQPLLSGQIDLAAVNTHSQCVVSGTTEDIENFTLTLQERGIEFQRLHTSHAFHSIMTEPVLEEFAALVRSIQLSSPQLPYISNVTGTWITPEQATDPLYWSQHMRQQVRFADGILEILQEPAMVLLEVGPGRTLGTFARAQDNLLDSKNKHSVISSLRQPTQDLPDDEFLLTGLGRLWLAGVTIDWDKLHADAEPCRVPLPTYPFERKRYWVNPPQQRNASQETLVRPGSEAETLEIPEEAESGATLYPRPDLSTRYVAPRNRLETTLTTLWQELLGVSQVGIYDSFFELGGHSLLATQLISRLRSNLQIHLPLSTIFEATTIAELGQRIEEYTSTQVEEALAQPILPVARTGKLPLSHAQRRLWFMWQMEPDAGFFNIPLGVRLQGPLQLDVLEKALQELTIRHEVLRTTFISQENEPELMIAPALKVTIERVDLREIPASKQESTLQHLATGRAQQLFDLERGPLLRATIFLLDQETAVLLIAIHHLISDGWSLGVLVGELLEIYQAFRIGQPSPLEPLVVQYVDVAAWQRKWLEGAEFVRQLAYWREQLSGPLPALELPADHPRPVIQTYRGAHFPFELPELLTERLNNLSQQEHVTMFMLLLAAFQVICARYSGQEDILIGTPIANRRRVEIEKLIGCFINTLVIRTKLTGDISFRELLQRVREKTLEAFAHQDLPFEQLVEALQPERDLSRSPIFQVMFMLQNVPTPATEIADLHMSTLDIDNGATQFDLTLVVNETDQRITGLVEYNVDLFDAATIKRIVEHWQHVLGEVVKDCTQNIADLPLLTEEEQHSFASWNTTLTAWDAPSNIPQMFISQVASTPHAPALVWENSSWTYDELNRAANRVAHTLLARGVGPGHLVGVCLERSDELVIALLGVLKAGAAYVPLDPAYPQERLSFMLTDSRATALLTQEIFSERLPHLETLAVITLPLPDDYLLQWEKDPEVAIGGETLAYIIYTSGSTGKPKGVMISHRALRNCFLSMAQQPGMTASDRILAVTSFSFDIAALELLLPLTVGASLTIASQAEVADAQALCHRLDVAQATFMQATPATWHMLLNIGWHRKQHLKVLCGGEALPQTLAQQLCQHDLSVWNMYGPTETTIWSSICQVQEGDTPISIGNPI
ncbi:MAG TPA: condensation domain-containing protein, partial [Ktedonobacteraceae bacterium]|nr:condensation domain-containing protein [Ktedonobacteraceae bacterium]